MRDRLVETPNNRPLAALPLLGEPLQSVVKEPLAGVWVQPESDNSGHPEILWQSRGRLCQAQSELPEAHCWIIPVLNAADLAQPSAHPRSDAHAEHAPPPTNTIQLL